MKVLLCEDVEKLGWIGDVVDVKDGYARNYLLPYGVATVPTEANIKSLAEAKAKGIEERKIAAEKLQHIADAVDGAEAVVSAKANEMGHLFGSVTAKEIAENLREQGFEITDSMVRLGEHIKEVGTHEVKLRMAEDVNAKVSVVVVSADAEVEAEAEAETETEEETNAEEEN